MKKNADALRINFKDRDYEIKIRINILQVCTGKEWWKCNSLSMVTLNMEEFVKNKTKFLLNAN